MSSDFFMGFGAFSWGFDRFGGVGGRGFGSELSFGFPAPLSPERLLRELKNKMIKAAMTIAIAPAMMSCTESSESLMPPHRSMPPEDAAVGFGVADSVGVATTPAMMLTDPGTGVAFKDGLGVGVADMDEPDGEVTWI